MFRNHSHVAFGVALLLAVSASCSGGGDSVPLVVITQAAADKTVTTDSNCQALVPDFTVGVVASARNGGPVSYAQSPVEGATLFSGLGPIPVTVTATDTDGNAAVCVAMLQIVSSASCKTGSLVAIPAGTFQMGEVGVASPVHAVTISYSFWMGADEVTRAQYRAVMGSLPSQSQSQSDPYRPVTAVTWTEARQFCAALTSQQVAAGIVPSGLEFRLPTEAEWEYACRAGSTTSWNVGLSIGCGDANLNPGTSQVSYCVGQTVAVGSYPPNAWGIRDMHGNAREWCLDADSAYVSGPVTDPFVAGSYFNKVIRGGGCLDSALYCRSAARDDQFFNFRDPHLGFRIVLGPIRVP